MTLSRAQGAVVVDASSAVRFLLDDPLWRQHWEVWIDAGTMLLAPAHFPAEVGNSLLRSVRLPVNKILVGLSHLARTGVETVHTRPFALNEAVTLADKHQLTVYDALYLQLAIDVEGELATLDADLRRAAAAEQVPTV